MAERSLLITGCSSGIGACCAHGMKARGWRVIATARKKADLAQLEQDGLEALYLDYTEPKSIEACAKKALEMTDGRLGALFNNGAYGQPGAVEDLSVDVLRDQFEANFFGWHHLTQLLIPHMRANGGGRIVQNSSLLGLVSLKYRGAYNASKFAVEGLTDALRQELRGSGIKVSTIEPGPIASKFAARALHEYKTNIDLKNSAHAAIYEERVATMEKDAPNPLRLGPEAVLSKLIHALESRWPKPRYYVTLPTHALAFARRVLPTRLLDLVMSNE